MATELYLPLQDIIKRAAESKAEGPASQIKKRFDNVTETTVLLADCSGSMLDLVGNSNLRKCEHLAIAIDDVLKYFPKIRIVGFNFVAREVKSPKHLPTPAGGTDLGGALDYIQPWRPKKTIVVSDGMPDSEEEALEAAQRVSGAIDTIYCGPDGHPAVAFLRSLARQSAGRAHVVWEGYRQISSCIRGLLG